MSEVEKIHEAVCGSADRPLQVGDIEIPCYVLDDDTRVVVQRGMVQGLDMKYGGSANGADRLSRFVRGKAVSAYISEELSALIDSPIKFKTSGGVAYGYPATALVDICEAVLAARADGVLQEQQMHIAQRCEILVRGWARVGIIALIDEATGFQDVRATGALAEIYEKFLAKELQPWTKTFQDSFYKNIFDLNRWPYTAESIKRRPGVIGRWTNDIVYDRLAPGVKVKLHEFVGRDPTGRLRARLFQGLTKDVGYQKLLEHLAAVQALMKAATSWKGFMRLLDRALPPFPKVGDTYRLPLPKPNDDKDNE